MARAGGRQQQQAAGGAAGDGGGGSSSNATCSDIAASRAHIIAAPPGCASSASPPLGWPPQRPAPRASPPCSLDGLRHLCDRRWQRERMAASLLTAGSNWVCAKGSAWQGLPCFKRCRNPRHICRQRQPLDPCAQPAGPGRALFVEAPARRRRGRSFIRPTTLHARASQAATHSTRQPPFVACSGAQQAGPGAESHAAPPPHVLPRLPPKSVPQVVQAGSSWQKMERQAEHT